MNWFFAVLASTLLFSVVSILDKRLLAGLFPSFTTFNITFGLLQFLIAPMFLVAVILTVGFDGGGGVSWALASGLLWAVGLSLFFYALNMEEVSRVSPMQSITPVFTAIIAVALFDESITLLQWLAIVIVVMGAVMINLRSENGRIQIAHRKAFLVLLASAFVLAWAFIVSDQATDRMNVWATQGFRALAMGTGVLAITWRPRHTASVIATIRNRRIAPLMLLTEGFLAPTASLIFVYALSIGPVALVSTVFAVRPLSVLAISTFLSTGYWNVLNEPLDRSTLGLKLFSTLLIVGGVMLLGF